MFNQEKLKDVPQKPGVYLWKNQNQEIIYVGKAKKLKTRMKQYFLAHKNPRTKSLVSHIVNFEYIITSNDRDALLLERNLIRQHNPEYNVLLTDDKRYPYIKLVVKKELEVSIVRFIKNDHATYYGPFPSGFGARNIYHLIIRLTKYKAGLPHHTNEKDYWLKQLEKAKELLKPTNNSYYKKLETEMHQAASNMQYEIAQDIKQSLDALNFYRQNDQIVQLNSAYNIDVYGIVESQNLLAISMMFFRYGILLSKRDLVLEVQDTPKDTIRQFIAMYYEKNLKPDLVIIDQKYYDELDLFANIKFINPLKGRRKKILEVAKLNSDDNLSFKLAQYKHKLEITTGAIAKLGILLGIPKPTHLLMFDNSHTNNTNPVGVVVSYKNGLKRKNEYLKFNLETDHRLADVDYMEQAIGRYFKPEKHRPIPNLLIVDGGIAQIHAAKQVLAQIALELNIVGLVKDEKHQTRAIIGLNEEELVINDQQLFAFLGEVQDEVDRFAKYAHSRRSSISSFQGTLTRINGVGESTVKKLLHHFKTYNAIYNASLIALEKVVSQKQAKNIYKGIHHE